MRQSGLINWPNKLAQVKFVLGFTLSKIWQVSNITLRTEFPNFPWPIQNHFQWQDKSHSNIDYFMFVPLFWQINAQNLSVPVINFCKREYQSTFCSSPRVMSCMISEKLFQMIGMMYYAGIVFWINTCRLTCHMPLGVGRKNDQPSEQNGWRLDSELVCLDPVHRKM